MLRGYDNYKYFYSYSAGIDFSRQNLTSKVDPRAVRVKHKTALSRHCLHIALELSDFSQILGHKVRRRLTAS